MRTKDRTEEQALFPSEAASTVIDEADPDGDMARLTRRLAQLEPARLRPTARRRIAARLAAQAAAENPGGQGFVEDRLSQAEARVFRQLAGKLGVSLEELWRYVGPRWAAQFGRFLGVPGYSGMFALLGFLLRAFKRLHNLALTL